MSRPSRALTLLAALSVSGCAFSLEGPRADRPRDKRPQCDTSKALVGFDIAVATVSGIAAIALLKADAGDVAVLPIGIGALYVAGAVSGSHSVDECRVAVAEYDVEVERAHIADVSRPQQSLASAPVREPALEIQQPVLSPPTVTPAVTPAPVPVVVAPPPAKPPAPAPAPAPAPPDDDDWSAFWKEVP